MLRTQLDHGVGEASDLVFAQPLMVTVPVAIHATRKVTDPDWQCEA
jgi:hypothetical protein